jgi:peptidoglycan/LPS O-acetylase OafA/YrhL
MGLLRLLLTFTVVAAHNPRGFVELTTGGIVAVKAFYIMSGFYMGLILCGPYAKAGARVFWGNRLLRLMPMYYAVVAITLAILLLIPGGKAGYLLDLGRWKALFAEPGLGWLKAYLVAMNLTCVGLESTIFAWFDFADRSLHPFVGVGYPASAVLLNHFMLIPQSWSISVELFMYAMAPFVIRRSNRTLFALIAAGLLLRVGLRVCGLDFNPVNRSVAPLEFVYFLMGVASYRLYARLRERRPPAWAAPVGTAAVVACTVGFTPLSKALGMSIVFETWLWWAYFAGLTLGLPLVFAAMKDYKWDRAAGELTYPMYLCHILIIGLFEQFGGQKLFDAVGGRLGWQCMHIATTMAVGWLLIVGVGLPVERLRQARLKAAQARAAAPTPPHIEVLRPAA